ncbi:hypothetical protein [Limnohabitans sp. 15K]|jgi:hypothetical protein|uniref:hypothetical protein n=1 Tax=Limnohabitans sp. 15K TaxID=1100706 RepID=UPI0013042FEF|nr:hypothetical protein [Limnohabitans sp. 15K]
MSFSETIMQHECMNFKESAMSYPATDSKMVKSIGASGQISLGKEFAGRQVLIESPAKGVWIIRTATITPDHEPWPEEEKAQTGLKKGRTGKTPSHDQTSRKKSQA